MKVSQENILLERIKQLVVSGKYRVRIHTIRHMIAEGFYEANIIETVTGESRIIENYPDDCRCLILGRFHFKKAAISSLHVVCEYSRSDLIDIVTAYIPQKPWWVSSTQRGKM